MNKLIAQNGGMPLELDDLIFIQDAFKDALKGVLHGFVKAKFGNVILSGCEVSDLGGGNYSLSAGYVMLGYEICYVPAVTTSFVITALIVDVNYDPAGNDTFFDGVTRDTYEKKTAKPFDNNSSLTNPYLLVSDENRLTHLMPEVMKSNWALTDFIGEKYVFQSSDFKNGASAISYAPPYLIKKNGVVRFYGAIDIPAGIGPRTIVLEIPLLFRKGIDQGATASVYLCSRGQGLIRMGLDAGNLLYLDTALVASANGYGVSLNQISYDVDDI